MKVKKIFELEGSETAIKGLFEHNGQEAEFTYTLIGREIGIDECSYVEKPEEDIYGLIHDWVEAYITTESKIVFDGKKVDYEGIVLTKD